MGVRQESDLLGTREIENSLYYGVHTLRAIENFKISDRVVNDMPELIRGMVLVKKAVALTNKELRVVDPKIVDAIVAACDQVLSTGKCMDQFPVDCFQGGAGTSTNMNTNEVIANIALEILGHPKGTYSIVNPNDHVNESQSTNDAYPTGIRLALYKMTHDLIGAIDYLKEGLLEKADEFKDVLKMGRTQLQDAVPMLLGQEFNAFASLLASESKELEETVQRILTVNLGATAIGTGVNTPAGFQPVAIKYLSEVTGYSCKGATDLLAATYDCSDFVTLHSGLKRAAIRLSKICNDLRLLASGPRTGLKEINLPELQAGSSIMPAKVNPVLPEVVNQACFKVMGNDVTVMMAADAGQLQLNVMEPVIAQSLFESIQLLKNSCISLRDKCIDGITVNDMRCLNDVVGSIAIITYLSPIIGHHEGDLVGKICAQTGRSIQEVVIERGLMTKEALDELFTVENLKKPRYTPTRF